MDMDFSSLRREKCATRNWLYARQELDPEGKGIRPRLRSFSQPLAVVDPLAAIVEKEKLWLLPTLEERRRRRRKSRDARIPFSPR